MAVVPPEELASRREAIRRQMNEQRRIIERDLEPQEQHYEPNQYPRSHTMRFLMRNSNQLGNAINRGVTLMMIAKMFKTSSLVRTLATMALTRQK